MQDGRYDIRQVYKADAPVRCGHFWGALRSWSVWPFYIGLLVIYLIAQCTGQIALFAVVGH